MIKENGDVKGGGVLKAILKLVKQLEEDIIKMLYGW